jgi:hypothetical protein
VYVDGKFAARLPPPGYKSTVNDTFVVDGGMPLKLDSGNIYLCGRADGDPDRHYSGSIAHLQIFDETLKPSQVWFLAAVLILGREGGRRENKRERGMAEIMRVASKRRKQGELREYK